jgi:separase
MIRLQLYSFYGIARGTITCSVLFCVSAARILFVNVPLHSDMATRAQTRRPVVSSQKQADVGKRAAPISTGDITNGLASLSTTSKAKGARNDTATGHSRSAKSTQDKRVAAMRAVNAASQGLTVVMKSGWKAPRAEPSSKKSTASTHEAFNLSTSARTALGGLRGLLSGDVDVERAAISVAGKLLSLDMVSCRFISPWVPGLFEQYSHAMDVLSDMHSGLVALVRPELTPPTSHRNSQTSLPPRQVISIISLPLPSLSLKPLDSTLFLLISTYLSHTLIVLSHHLTSSTPKHTQLEILVLFSQTLHDSPSLLTWVPLCTEFPSKQHDVLLTRAYTALTSVSSQASGASEAVFRIRVYALMCLLRTSGSTIGPKTFWDQVVKSSSSFARSASSKDEVEERRLCRVVTSAFSELLAMVEERENKDDFLHGKPFISFCDAWISYSKSVSSGQSVSGHHSIFAGRRCGRIKQSNCAGPVIAINILRG